MAKSPKSVTVILGLVIAGIQAIAEIMKVTKTDNNNNKEEKDGESTSAN